MNNLPKVEREALRPGIEPATFWLQVRRPNHYATMPHCVAWRELLFTETNWFDMFLLVNVVREVRGVPLSVVTLTLSSGGSVDIN